SARSPLPTRRSSDLQIGCTAMRQLGRPQNDVARLTLDLRRLPMIQPWMEVIKIVPERVPLKPRIQVLINLGQALETTSIPDNVRSEEHTSELQSHLK